LLSLILLCCFVFATLFYLLYLFYPWIIYLTGWVLSKFSIILLSAVLFLGPLFITHHT
jgi:hypothetical protein